MYTSSYLTVRHSRSTSLCQQPGHEFTRGELRALVGVKDLWPAAASQRDLQSIETELRAKAFRELPADQVPGVSRVNKVDAPFNLIDTGHTDAQG